jgi:hypothetical protein
MELKNMEHRVVRLDLSSPDKPSFAICEVFSDDSDEIVHYALNRCMYNHRVSRKDRGIPSGPLMRQDRNRLAATNASQDAPYASTSI